MHEARCAPPPRVCARRRAPIASEIIALSGCGVTFMLSTMARMGLLVRCAILDTGTAVVHAPPVAAIFVL